MNQDGDGGSDNGGRDIFATNSDIFENRDLLKVGYVPGLDQIVGREEQIQSVGQSIGSATVGDSPDTLLIYGEDRMRQVSRGSCSYSRGKAKSCERTATTSNTHISTAPSIERRLKRVGKSLADQRGRSVTPILISPGRAIGFGLSGYGLGDDVRLRH